MKWRDVLVGSIATLVVTILSGVVVYYLTKEPKAQPKEKLVYSLEHSASFASQKNALLLASVVIANTGDDAAENVVGAIKFPAGSIKDKKIETSSGSVSGFLVAAETAQNLEFKMPRLLPKEKVSISFLIESAAASTPEVSLKSNRAVGEKVSMTTEEKKPEERQSKELLAAFVPLFFGLTALLALLVFSRVRMRNISRGSCLNNSAFVLMHKGLTDMGAELLHSAVSEGRDGCHAIANYATCLAAKGEYDNSSQFLAAAEFLANTPHEKAVCAFNRTLIALMKGETKPAQEALADALRLSKKEIMYYCKNSDLFASLSAKAPEVRSLIEERGA